MPCHTDLYFYTIKILLFSHLRLSLELLGESLKSPSVRNVESLSCSRSEIRALSFVNVKEGLLLENVDVAAFLGKGIHSLDGLLLNRSHELRLLLLKFLLDRLVKLLNPV